MKTIIWFYLAIEIICDVAIQSQLSLTLTVLLQNVLCLCLRYINEDEF